MSSSGYPPYQQDSASGTNPPPYPPQQQYNLPYPPPEQPPYPYPQQQPQYPLPPIPYPPSSNSPQYPPVPQYTGTPQYPPGSGAPHYPGAPQYQYASGAPQYYPGGAMYPPSSAAYGIPQYPPSSGDNPYSSANAYPYVAAAPPPPQPHPTPSQEGSYYRSLEGSRDGQCNSSESCSSQTATEGTPTLFPVDPFNAQEDAEILRKAMKGIGTDEKAIISILADRNNEQRQEIVEQFKTLYGKDLIKNLKKELTGNFEKLIIALVTPLPQFYAEELHEALSGLGTDEDPLIEALCTLSNKEIREIRETYESLFDQSLEDDLKSDTHGTFKRLMVSLCNAARDETMEVNEEAAADDARALLQAGQLQLGTDESTFNMIFCQRNYAQLQIIIQEYERITGNDIEEAVKGEFSGDAEQGLLAIIRCVKNKPEFFAKRIHQSLSGMGTNDRQLIRLIVTRCEIDMEDIKMEYGEKYGKSLGEAIRSDCSGDYKKCLLALIGEA